MVGDVSRDTELNKSLFPILHLREFVGEAAAEQQGMGHELRHQVSHVLHPEPGHGTFRCLPILAHRRS
jgi:hypothetical protein